MQFNYMYVQESMGSVEIDDIGNFCISVTNDFYKEWLMIVTTMYGITEVIQYGPLNIDFDELDSKVTYTYQRFDYSESKICKMVDYYINDNSKMTTQVTVIDFEDARNKIKSMVDYLCKENI